MKDYENIPMLKPILDYLNINGECDYYHIKLKRVLTHYLRENNQYSSLREYDKYSYEEIYEVVYSYIFEYFTYYQLDSEVLNLRNPTGDKSREILLNLGIDEEFKNYFVEISPYETIKILKELYHKRNDIRYKLIAGCIDSEREYWDLFGWFSIRDNCAMKLLNINVFSFKGIGIPDYLEEFWGIDNLKSEQNPVYFIFNDNRYEVNIKFFYIDNIKNSFFRIRKGYESYYKEYYINWEKSGFQKDIISVLSKIDKFCHKNYKYPNIKFEKISEDTYKICLMQSFNEEIDISKYFKEHKKLELPQFEEVIYEIVELDIEKAKEISKKSKNKNCKRKKNYEKSEKENKIIGNRGEQVVLLAEKDKLIKYGIDNIDIRHIALYDDSAGFDILSYDESGEQMYIEVKSTKAKVGDLDFFLTSNELETAKLHDNYWIYIVFEVNTKNPKIWRLKNPFKQKNMIRLVPTQYRASVKVI